MVLPGHLPPNLTYNIVHPRSWPLMNQGELLRLLWGDPLDADDIPQKVHLGHPFVLH